MNLIKRIPDFFDDETLRFPARFLDRPFAPDHFFNGTGMPAVNIKENAGEFLIEMAAPGFRKEDLHVNLEDGVLTISSERKEEKKEEKDRYTRREFRYNSFSRSFTLPQSADETKVKATFKDGVLQLSVPKQKELAKAKAVKEIAIG